MRKANERMWPRSTWTVYDGARACTLTRGWSRRRRSRGTSRVIERKRRDCLLYLLLWRNAIVAVSLCRLIVREPHPALFCLGFRALFRVELWGYPELVALSGVRLGNRRT